MGFFSSFRSSSSSRRQDNPGSAVPGAELPGGPPAGGTPSWGSQFRARDSTTPPPAGFAVTPQAGGAPAVGVPQPASRRSTFTRIVDQFSSLDQVQTALRGKGLESSSLIVGVDFTKSNEWTGKHSYGGRSLHDTSQFNPYQQAISIVGETLQSFDDDNLIPCYGFGDALTHDASVFAFHEGDRPCEGFHDVISRYNEIVRPGGVKLAGPTSFAPVINKAIDITVASGCQYHILLIIADGQVTRSSDLPPGQMSPQEQATVDAIVAASHFPLSIVVVGVGDGPWEVMQHFDDNLPQRVFDNYQFVSFSDVMLKNATAPSQEAAFALNCLMEIPDQYATINRLGMLSRVPPNFRPRSGEPMPPPVPAGGRSTRPPVEGRTAAPAAPAAPAATAPEPNPRWVCPITLEVMKDPVMATDGYLYEKSAVQNYWAQCGQLKSPMLGTPLDSDTLIPNHPLRSEIMEAMEKRR